MNVQRMIPILLASATLLLLVAGSAGAQDPLAVCATVPDIGSLAREIGGDAVSVTVFCKGPGDPHFVEANPGFVKALSKADALVMNGLELEIGWLPVLLKGCRNAAVLPGAAGHVDASTAIAPLGVPAAPLDRSQGDVHAQGNPHFLADPLNGLKVARLLRDRFSALRPGGKAEFDRRYASFRERLGVLMAGEALAKKYDFERLAVLHEKGDLAAFLEKQGDRQLLGGWFGKLVPRAGTKAVADHDLWPYFARRFRIEVVGFLEPIPGVPPTTKHLAKMVGAMKAQGVKIVLTSPYYDPCHAEFVAGATGARIVTLVHQTGAKPEAGDYLAAVEWNVGALARALEGGG